MYPQRHIVMESDRDTPFVSPTEPVVHLHPLRIKRNDIKSVARVGSNDHQGTRSVCARVAVVQESV